MINAAQAKRLRQRAERYAAWSDQYRKPNGWTVITKEEQATCPANARMTNEQRGLLEQFEILRDLPDKLFAYVSFHEREIASRYSETPRMSSRFDPGFPLPQVGDQARVKVWTGDILGSGRCNKVYHGNMGDLRASVSVVIGGATYSGTAFVGAGDYVRLRKLKAR